MTSLLSREMSWGNLLLPSDTHCTDFFIEPIAADELRRMESGGGLGSSSSIGEAGDVVSGADSAEDTAATATASGDDPVVAGELDCELGGGGNGEWWWRRLRRRVL